MNWLATMEWSFDFRGLNRANRPPNALVRHEHLVQSTRNPGNSFTTRT